jgi:hypothetical protein
VTSPRPTPAPRASSSPSGAHGPRRSLSPRRGPQRSDHRRRLLRAVEGAVHLQEGLPLTCGQTGIGPNCRHHGRFLSVVSSSPRRRAPCSWRPSLTARGCGRSRPAPSRRARAVRARSGRGRDWRSQPGRQAVAARASAARAAGGYSRRAESPVPMPSREPMRRAEASRGYPSGGAASNAWPASRIPVAQPARSSSRRRTSSAGCGAGAAEPGGESCSLRALTSSRDAMVGNTASNSSSVAHPWRAFNALASARSPPYVVSV